MNIYEQLEALRTDLVQQGAKTKTIRLIDETIGRTESQKNSALSFTKLQVLRRLMSMPAALNDEEVRLDLIGLEGDLEDQAAERSVERPAYEPEANRPKLKKYYKKK